MWSLPNTSARSGVGRRSGSGHGLFAWVRCALMGAVASAALVGCDTETSITEFDSYDPLLASDASVQELPPWAVDVATGTTATSDATSSCSGAGSKPDGSCCPPGQAWDDATGTCGSPGPAGCFATGTEDSLACQPRWCFVWKDAAGVACTAGAAGCVASGAACPANSGQLAVGCAVGEAPGPGCAQVGRVVLPGKSLGTVSGTGGVWAEGAQLSPLPAISPLVGPPTATTPTAAPTWCLNAQGDVTDASTGVGCTTATCAVGERLDPTTLLCTPVTGPAWSCPQGFLSSSTGSCSPDPADCALPWGGVQPDAGVFFVQAGAAAGGDGSQAKPLASVDEALPLLPLAGGTIVLGSGTYTGNWTVTKPVTIRGVCADTVTLNGLSGKPTLRATGAGLISLAHLAVTGGRYGIRVEGQTQAQLDHVWIHGAAHVGLGILDGAVGKLANSVVSGTLPGDQDTRGDGIAVDASQLQVQNVRVSGNRSYGIYLTKATSSLGGSGLVIDGTLPTASDSTHGIGLQASSGPQVSLDDVRVAGNRCFGVRVDGGAVVSGHNWWIAGTLPYASLSGGAGLAIGASSVDLTGLRLTKNSTRGLWALGAGNQIKVENLRVSETLAQASDLKRGVGVDVEGSDGQVALSQVHLSDNRSAGIAAVGTVQLTLRAVLIEDTLARDLDGAYGYGLQIAGGASLGIPASGSVAIRRSRDAGLLVDGAGTTWVGGTVRVWDTQSSAGSGSNGQGARVQGGAYVQNVVLDVSNSQSGGILVTGAGTVVQNGTLSAVLSKPRASDEGGGIGIQIAKGASVAGRVSTLGSYSAGIQLADAGSSLTATPSSTQPAITIGFVQPRNSDATGGHGLDIGGGAKVTSGPTRIHDVHLSGVFVHNAGSALAVDRMLLTLVKPAAISALSYGVSVTSGGNLVAKDVRVDGAADIGLFMDGTTTTADVQDLTVVGSRHGVHVQHGSNLAGSRYRLENSAEVGLFASQTATEVAIADLTIHGGGFGINVTNRADVKIARGALVQLMGAGVVVDGGSAKDKAATLRLADVRLDTVTAMLATSASGVSEVGHGLAAVDAAVLELVGVTGRGFSGVGLLGLGAQALDAHGVWLHDGSGAGVIVQDTPLTLRGARINGVSGVGLLQDGSQVSVSDLAVQSVGFNTLGQGDGVFLFNSGTMLLTRTLVAQVAGTGLVFLAGALVGDANRIVQNASGILRAAGTVWTWSRSLVTGNPGGDWREVGVGTPVTVPKSVATWATASVP